MFVKQSLQDQGESVQIDWKQPFTINTEKRSCLFLFLSTLGVESIFESDITAHLLSGQQPSHFTKSAVVIVLYFLQEVFSFDIFLC